MILQYLPDVDELELVAKRPIEHKKGSKVLMRIPLGEAIPPGVILGKGTRLIIQAKRQHSTEKGVHSNG
jgi:hypothetical protein